MKAHNLFSKLVVRDAKDKAIEVEYIFEYYLKIQDGQFIQDPAEAEPIQFAWMN